MDSTIDMSTWQPIIPEGMARAVLGVAISLSIASVIFVSLRIWVRSASKCFGVEDWLISAALLVVLAHGAVASYGTFTGIGTFDDQLTNPAVVAEGHKVVFVWFLLYILSWVLVKLSICTAIHRITSYQRRRYVLYALMALAVVTFVVFVVGLLIYFSPHEARWHPADRTWTEDSRINAAQVLAAVTYLLSAVEIVSDVIVALFSVLVLTHLRMKRSLKITVGVALSLGILASAATMGRLPLIPYFYKTENYLRAMGHFIRMSTIESNVAVVAASLPMLFKLASGSKPRPFHDPEAAPVGAGVFGRRSSEAQASPRNSGQPDLITIGRIRSKRGLVHHSYLSYSIAETDDLRPPEEIHLKEEGIGIAETSHSNSSAETIPSAHLASARSSSALCDAYRRRADMAAASASFSTPISHRRGSVFS